MGVGFLLSSNVFAQPSFIHLPYQGNTFYQCTQANHDRPTHQANSTKKDLDFGMPKGTDLFAAVDGKAYPYSSNDPKEAFYGGFGWHVKIIPNNHPGYYIINAHMSEVSVEWGQDVKVGDYIGKSGGVKGEFNSGTSFAPHLHFGLHKGDGTKSGMGESVRSQILAINLGKSPSSWVYGPAQILSTSDFFCKKTKKHDGYNRRGNSYQSFNFSSNPEYICGPGGKVCDIKDSTDGVGGGLGPQDPPPLDKVNTKACLDLTEVDKKFYNSKGEETYTFTVGDQITIKADYQNVGSCDVPKRDKNGKKRKRVKTMVLSSKGYKRDSHRKWKVVAKDKIKIEHLTAGRHPHGETYTFQTPLRPGVYNYTTCIDRTKRKGNKKGYYIERHESDNCGRDVVIEVVRPEQPEPAPAITMDWSSEGDIAGKHCIGITQKREPLKNGWDNNKLCFDKDYGVVWSENGAIDGMRCTLVTEPKDPHWKKNTYLCAPQEVEGFSEFSFAWSHKGPIEGKACIAITEPNEPKGHRWGGSNHLCYTAIEKTCVKPNLNAGQVSSPTGYDFVIDHVGANKLTLSPGELFHPTALACANGGQDRETRIAYYLSSCDGSSPVYMDDDGVDEDNYDSSGCSAESINKGISAPWEIGKHILTVCADYQRTVLEDSEDNNCNHLEIEVK